MTYALYPNYKTGDYFDFLPNEWNEERLRDITAIKTSNVDKKIYEGQEPVQLCNYVDVYYHSRINSKITFMKSTASDAEIKRFKLNVGDVVITKDSEDPFDIGIPSLIDEKIDDLVCGYHLSIMETYKDRLTGRYLFYALESDASKHQFTLASNGVTRFGLTQQGTKNLRICVPSISEQQKIADFLDYKTQQIDQLIEKKKALIEKLNEQRIAVITQSVTKGIDKNAKMKPSDVDWLGDVPAHWEVRQLKFIASYNDESLPETTDSDKEIHYVDISSVNHVNGITEIDLTTFEKAPSRARRIVRDGDTIVSTVRTYLKAIATVINPPDNMIVSTGFAVIRSTEIINATFLSYFLLSQKFIDTVVANSKGVSYPAINASELACIHIAFPEDKLEQKRIVDHVDERVNRIDKMTDLNIKTIERLKEYRSSLITAAVTGKIDVRDVKIGNGRN